MSRPIVVAVLALVGAAFCVAPCAFTACSPPPVPAPVPIAGAMPADACASLASLQCPEGLDPTCVAVVTDMLTSRFIEQRAVGCLAASKSPAEARACKTVACKGVP